MVEARRRPVIRVRLAILLHLPPLPALGRVAENAETEVTELRIVDSSHERPLVAVTSKRLRLQ